MIFGFFRSFDNHPLEPEAPEPEDVDPFQVGAWVLVYNAAWPGPAITTRVVKRTRCQIVLAGVRGRFQLREGVWRRGDSVARPASSDEVESHLRRKS